MAVEPESEAMPRDEALDLRVEVVPGRRHTLSGVKNIVRVVMRIVTPADDAEDDRPPISVACVLDRSGSMDGTKLDFAKRACKKFVKHLKSGDTLHFITYDDKVQTIFENGDLSDAGKDALKTRIDEIRTGGTTNLHGGLERAAALLGSRADFNCQSSVIANNDGRVKRIFLFSDGHVNAGITDPHEIKRRVTTWADEGITTTSFGIGSDFDEPLMRGIAESGKGRYTFLANAQDIPRLVSKSIHDLLKLYGSEASVDIRGGAHTTVAKVYRGDDDDEGSHDPASSGLLQLGDLHNANSRMILLELDSAPHGDVMDGHTFRAAEWFLSFQRDGAPVQFSGSVDLVAVKQRAALGNEAAAVQAMFAIRRASDMELEVAHFLSHGDTVRAKDVKSQQMALLKETLEVARNAPEVDPVDIEALEAVLHRAERLAERLDKGEDLEIVRRHCVQETELNRCLSIAGFSDGRNSSPGGSGCGDGNHTLQHRLRDFDDMSDASVSPRGSANASDDESTPSRPLTPRSIDINDSPEPVAHAHPQGPSMKKMKLPKKPSTPGSIDINDCPEPVAHAHPQGPSMKKTTMPGNASCNLM